MKIFKNRQAAGQILAERLKDIKADLVLGIPRGGVVVAAEVAKKLKLPLDIIVTRKIGVPSQPELALGAVDSDGETVWEENLLRDLGFKIYDLREEIQKEWKEVKRREQEYRGERRSLDLEGKIVILIDDGMATGATVLAAVRYLKRHKASVILAMPVASQESVEMVKPEADKLIVLHTPSDFQAVGQFYQEFLPISDQEVVQLLS